MLFPPVYLHCSPITSIKSVVMMHEAPIPMVRAATPPDTSRPEPESEPEALQEPEILAMPPVPEPVIHPEPEVAEEKLPMLVCGENGIKAVFPKEATRDVLCGKVDYYLVDENGITLLKRKHFLNTVKLDQETLGRFGEFDCLGAHQRQLAKRPRKWQGLGYRRRFLSPEMIRKGIYVS